MKIGVLGLGFVDDIAVLSWVLEKIRDDVEKFKNWEKNKDGNEKDNIA